MNKLPLITYGHGHKTIVLVHGGPSLFGYMESLGKILSSQYSIVEYAQRGTLEYTSEYPELKIETHISDLFEVIHSCKGPVILLGHSWGACLALLYASQHPMTIERIIVVSIAPMEESISIKFGTNLQSKLNKQVKDTLAKITKKVSLTTDPEIINQLMQERLNIISHAYHFEPTSNADLPSSRWNYVSYCETFDSFWALVQDGSILKKLAAIQDPVVVIHGEHDIIPMSETFDFLKIHLPSAQLISIPKSGHFPWIERYSKERFIEVLLDQLS